MTLVPKARLLAHQAPQLARRSAPPGIPRGLRRTSLAPSLVMVGEGEVSLVVMLDHEKSEVEVKLPGRFQVSPQIAGAIKAIPGIVAVEHV